MAQTRRSASAQNVALARAHLTRLGVVDDPHAWRMLSPDRRRLAALFGLPGLRFRIPTLPGLAARTLFFDAFVDRALDDGMRQVAVVGAGYDSRAWRLARPGVTFYEVDQPATQEDKRARAPGGGPVFVPADVTDPGLPGKLQEAGLRTDQPIALTLEGLLAYLANDDVAQLLARLADLAPTGSRMAVSFDSGFQNQHLLGRYARAYYRRAGEPWRFRLPAEDAPSFLAGAGWTLSTLQTLADLGEAHLGGTRLAGALGRLNSPSFVVTATR